jgi:hypothetical protein
MTADLSIIIVNLNTRGLLQACLASVFATSGQLAIEVIVIDNGSTDGSASMVATEFPAVRLVRNSSNEGFARPNNVGMEMATGRFLLLLNSDTIVRPEAFQTMLQFLSEHADAAACGPMLLYPDGRIQHSAKSFPTLFTHLCDMFFLDRLFPRSKFFGRGEMFYFDYHKAAPVDHLMAAAFLVKREILDQVGPLDEDFAIYYNDMDWCFRIRAHARTIWYVPDAHIVHYLGSTVGSLNRRFALFRMLHENVMLFYQKHYGRYAVVLYRVLTAMGFVMRSFGWTVVRVLRPSDHSRHMMTFSWKTLLWALPLWKPASVVGLNKK